MFEALRSVANDKEMEELCCIWCSQFSGNTHYHLLEPTLGIAGQSYVSL